ncbi:MAG: tetratricopeptide repeat protein [Azospirillaceae bacterium]|nr:tetratricopeptide repeat protein [Azospirillaceae bacterium]
MTDSADTLFAEAWRWHHAGDVSKAVAAYRRCLHRDPGHAEALHGLGVLALQEGDAASAETLIRSAIGREATVAQFHVSLATVRYRRADLAGAVVALRQAMLLDPQLASAQDALGVVLRALGRDQAAINSFTNAIMLAPDRADAYGNLGQALPAGAAARTALRRAVRVSPDLAAAQNNLANALVENGDWQGAVAHYQQAAALLPRVAVVHFNLGRALAVLEQTDAAIAAYRGALALNPGFAEALANLGPLVAAAGDAAAGRSMVIQAVVLRPDYGPACNNLAVMLLNVAEADAAARWLLRALVLRGGFDQAHVNLAEALYLLDRGGQPALARSYLAVWQQRFPEHPLVEHCAASLGVIAAPERCSDGYLQISFDQFAPTFDRRLASLGYRIPEQLAAVVTGLLGPATATLDILDAGCGTGLCAPLLRPWARRLDGVDLAPQMIEHARQRGLYDHLVVGELTAFMAAQAGGFDVIVATDVLIYFGALESLIAAAARALRPGGLLGVSIESLAGGADYRLGPHGRYAHGLDYLRTVLAGWDIVAEDPVIVRTEGAVSVDGLLVVARRG